MSLFYFHLNECGSVTRDEEGMEFADLETARHHATLAARGLMSAEVTEGRLCMSCAIEVMDENHQRVLYVPFSDVLTITGLKS